MFNNCADPTGGVGVEWDWLRFYYMVTPRRGSYHITNFAGLYEIYRRACTGNPETPCAGQAPTWNDILNSAFVTLNPSGRFQAFSDQGYLQGVEQW